MKILIVTDAWYPQVNGVVRTLDEIAKILRNQEHEVEFLTPDQFKTFPTPSYPEIKMAWNVWTLAKKIRTINPDAIHIATEGTLGVAARFFCAWNKIPYTSSYHTKLPEYIHIRYPLISESLVYCFLRWLHRESKAILVTTPSMLRELTEHNFKPRIVVWNRGADYNVFNPSHRKPSWLDTKILLYAGRISIEKNITAFLDLKIPNTIKVVVGDGPLLESLKSKYTHVAFLGYRTGVELAEVMANADVFVFPSKTDTFGIVMIEAAGCGTPIAAYPVTGPIDFVVEGKNGSLNEDLTTAIEKALQVSREDCYQHTKSNYSWEYCAKIFLDTLVKIEAKKKALMISH